MDKMQELVSEIKKGITQTTGSRKDEIQVTKAMLNDKTYEVGVYGKEGKIGTYNPSSAMRSFSATTISKAAKIPMAEAKAIMENHEFGKSEAEDVLGFSKELMNTYLHTGRKLPIGGREHSDVSLSLKQVEEGKCRYPMVVGVDEKGEKISGFGETFIPAYESVKVYAPCPAWKKK